MNEDSGLLDNIRRGAGYAIGTGVVALVVLLLLRGARSQDGTPTPSAEELLDAAKGCS